VAQVSGIDHAAITVAHLDAYRDLFGARTVREHAPDGKVLIRQIAIGGALLSVHRSGNGLDLVAKRPTIGAADICFRWSGSIESAASVLREHGIALIEGPTPRRTADDLPSQSIYFRDPDGNLLEVTAAFSG
jgi:catechol 2,3-dioxygenase-like lactoylglutathione lyase family enzyme